MLKGQIDDVTSMKSPGGFEFGIQGWNRGDPRPTSITFFLDGSAMVCDQHGYPIRGADVDGRRVWFATTPPICDRNGPFPYERRTCEFADGTGRRRSEPLATHAEVIAALAAERVDWLKLSWAGTPQLPYAQLVKLPIPPQSSIEELRRIPDPDLRRDALRARREAQEARDAEVREIESQ